MLRFSFLYSVMMTLAGSPLLAEPAPEPKNDDAPPAVVEVQPTLAKRRFVEQASAQVNGQTVVRIANVIAATGTPPDMLVVAAGYQIQCVMGEVDLGKLREFDPEIQGGDQQLSLVKLLQRTDRPRSLPVQQFRAVEQCLLQTGIMREIASPSVTLQTSGVSEEKKRDAVSTGPTAKVQWNHQETQFVVTAAPAENGRVNVHAEWAQREPISPRADNSAEAHRHSEKFNIAVELQPGETVLRSFEDPSTKADTPSLMILAITVLPADAQAASLSIAAEKPQLLPIPDERVPSGK